MNIRNNGNGTYSISKNLLEMTLDSNCGGRIISFKLAGFEFLIQEKDIHESFGSTLWPSPQSMWNWPPIKTFDTDPYKVKNEESTIEMNSAIDIKTGYSFTKSIKDSSDDHSLKIEFKITNEFEKESSVAPWQITRVKKGGLLFFPMGEGNERPKYFPLAKTEKNNGVVWYQTNYGEVLENHLLNTADGSEGWIAYAIDQRLFVKKFTDNKPDKFAPGEAEALFYTSSNQNYIEIEAQGVYEKLKQHESLFWDIEWFAVEIPKEIKIISGSDELVDFVRNLLEIQ